MFAAGWTRLRAVLPGGDLGRLVPIIMPRSCLELGWPGPIEPIGDLPFSVAWAVIPCPNLFNWVNDDQAERWDGAGIDWRARALANLARVSNGRRRYAGYKPDESGRPYFLSLLHDDAFGPSRLLLPHLFDDLLGPDYWVAIPEQTCAIAWRRDLTRKQRADVHAAIGTCFRHGTEPMSPDHFEAARFWAFDAERRRGQAAEPA